jgi:S1-C subfamily serine protease
MGMNISIISRDKGSAYNVQVKMMIYIFFILTILSQSSLSLSLAEQGRVVNEEMGIMVATITEEYKQDLNLDNANGVIVLGVLPGGPADEGGIHPGDIILGIADIAINNLDEYEDAIKKLKGRMDFNIMIRTRDGSFSFIQIISHEE